jgi:serine/threonine protein kinase
MDLLPSIPEDVTGLPWISHGISGAIFAVSESVLIKKPLPGRECREQLDIERRIYERLGPHPYITRFICAHKDMIVLERLKYSLRKHLYDLHEHNQLPMGYDVVRWASQVTQAIQYIHSRGVMQVDIGPHNVLLDQYETAKLSDFAGSSLDKSKPTVAPSAHSEHPNMPHTQPSIQSELFALGSMLYEIETANEPYPDKNEQELEELFKADKYPDTDKLILGMVITNCWMAQYEDASEAVVDIQNIQNQLNNTIPNVSL